MEIRKFGVLEEVHCLQERRVTGIIYALVKNNFLYYQIHSVLFLFSLTISDWKWFVIFFWYVCSPDCRAVFFCNQHCLHTARSEHAQFCEIFRVCKVEEENKPNVHFAVSQSELSNFQCGGVREDISVYFILFKSAKFSDSYKLLLFFFFL